MINSALDPLTRPWGITARMSARKAANHSQDTSDEGHQLELVATASPASPRRRAPRRALGAPCFQLTCFVAVALDALWQFGLARKTSQRHDYASPAFRE